MRNNVRNLCWRHFITEGEEFSQLWEADHPFGVYTIEHYPTASRPFQYVEDRHLVTDYLTLEAAMSDIWERHCFDIQSCLLGPTDG